MDEILKIEVSKDGMLIDLIRLSDKHGWSYTPDELPFLENPQSGDQIIIRKKERKER